jgi:hypothetical protein
VRRKDQEWIVWEDVFSQTQNYKVHHHVLLDFLFLSQRVCLIVPTNITLYIALILFTHPHIHPHGPPNPNPTLPLRRRQLSSLLGMSLWQVWLCATSRVEEAQVAIPAQAYDIDDKHPMLHGHVLEVCKLHPWPNHKVLGETGHVGVLEALGRGRAFEVGHGGEEQRWERG